MVAKKLEECLYRMAKTKEEYMNPSTLKKRLQIIAFSLGPDKDDETSEGLSTSGSSSNLQTVPQVVSVEAQQRINLLRNQNQQFEISMGGGVGGNGNFPQSIQSSGELQQSFSRKNSDTNGQSSDSNQNAVMQVNEVLQSKHLKPYQTSIAELQNNLMQAQVANDLSTQSSEVPSQTEKFQASGILSEQQKKKVIRQQQQRLILLRHASKCNLGPSCKIKFCSQMVKLWNHMKLCRDKDCTTAHCLSSRCVLNHYRICKDSMRTSTCEVCAPVMEIIRLQDGENGSEQTVNAKEIGFQNLGSLPPSHSVSTNAGVPSSMSVNTSNQLALELLAKQKRLEQQQQLLQKLNQQQDLKAQNKQDFNPMQQFQSLNQAQQLQLQNPQLYGLQMQLQNHQGNSGNSNNIKDLQMSFLQNLQQKNNPVQKPVDKSSQQPQSEQKPRISEGKGLSLTRENIQKQSSQFDAMPKITNKDENLLKNWDPLDLNSFDAFDSESKKSDYTSMSFKDSSSKKRDLEDLGDDTNEEELMPKLPRTDSHVSFMDMFDFNQDDEYNTNDSFSLSLMNDPTSSSQKDEKITPEQVKVQMLPLIQTVLDDPFGWLFKDPVDPIEYGIPDYFEIIKEPMHLSLVQTRLNAGYYKSIETVERDVKLVFENAINYNGEDSDVGQLAMNFLKTFTNETRKLK